MNPAQLYALRIKLISMPSGSKRDALAKHMFIIISTNDDAYGQSTDAQIAAVKTRAEIICREMGFPFRYADTQLNNPDDSHEATELVFTLAIDCSSKIPLEFVDAYAAANHECPIPEN